MLSAFCFVSISFQAACPYVTVSDKAFPSNHLEFKKTANRTAQGIHIDGETAINH